MYETFMNPDSKWYLLKKKNVTCKTIRKISTLTTRWDKEIPVNLLICVNGIVVIDFKSPYPLELHTDDIYKWNITCLGFVLKLSMRWRRGYTAEIRLSYMFIMIEVGWAIHEGSYTFSLVKSMFNNFHNTVFLIKADNPKCWQKYDSGGTLKTLLLGGYRYRRYIDIYRYINIYKPWFYYNKLYNLEKLR